MKKLIIASLLTVFTTFLFGQIEFGLRAGISSFDLASRGITINRPGSLLQINYRDANYGHHIGVYGRAKLLGIFVQPSILLNSNRVNYSIDEYTEGSVFSKVLSETYFNVDLPVVVGMKMGLLRLYGGPVGHVTLGAASDLVDIQGYSKQFQNMKYGYQAGVGVDLWKLRFDLAYEGNLSAFGSHITIDDKSYAFDNTASRVLTTVSYKF